MRDCGTVDIEEGYAVVLRPGEHMSRRAVSCPSGEYSVVHQHDGNVVVYRNADQTAIWATGTNYQRSVWNPEVLATRDLDRIYGRPGRLALEENGNLIVYCPEERMRWVSGVGQHPPFALMIHDSGRLVVMSVKGTIPWSSTLPAPRWDGWNRVTDGRRLRRGQCLRNASLTSNNGQFMFVVGEDTAAYLCRTDGGLVWVVGMATGEGYELTADGRLITRGADGVERAAESLGISASTAVELAARGAAEMLVTDDGELVIRDGGDDDDGGGTVLWTMRPVVRNAPSPDSDPMPLGARPKPHLPPGTPTLPADEEPNAENLPLVRTNFSDDSAWADAVARLSAHYDSGDGDPSIWTDVTPIDDPRYANLTAEQLAALVPPEVDWPMIAVADLATMASPQRHLLLVNLDEDSLGPTARATPAAAVEMAINLWLGNMDWEDFVGDPDYGGYDPDRVIEAMNIPEPG